MYDEIKGEEKNNKIGYILFLIILVLISVLLYFIFFNKDKKDCDKCDDTIVELPYQPINYSNYVFKMPIDWSFTDDNDNYGITNTLNNIFISFETLNVSYDEFKKDEFQINYIETMVTTNNMKIDQLKKFENCYLYEGVLNDYDYLIVAIGNDEKTVLVKTQFLDKAALNNYKNKVINFSLSALS